MCAHHLQRAHIIFEIKLIKIVLPPKNIGFIVYYLDFFITFAKYYLKN